MQWVVDLVREVIPLRLVVLAVRVAVDIKGVLAEQEFLVRDIMAVPVGHQPILTAVVAVPARQVVMRLVLLLVKVEMAQHHR
jgi:hypothetical protein